MVKKGIEKKKTNQRNTKGKEIPELPSKMDLKDFKSPSSPTKSLLDEERRNNSKLKLEIERLKKTVDVLKRTLTAKNDELEQKKNLINRMIERNLSISTPPDEDEELTRKTTKEDEPEGVEDLDIDSLLQANLGPVNITDYLNLSGCDLPDLPDLPMLETEPVEEEVSEDETRDGRRTKEEAVGGGRTRETKEEDGQEVGGGRRIMKTKVEAGGVRRSRRTKEEAGQEKTIVQILADQQKEATKKTKVSPLKLIKENDQFKLKRKRPAVSQSVSQCEAPSVSQSVSQYEAPSVSQSVSQCEAPSVSQSVSQCEAPSVSQSDRRATRKVLRCEYCDREFPLGGAWKLKKHILNNHQDRQGESCSLCQKNFIYKSALAAHMENHEKTFPWKCPSSSCGETLQELKEFVMHVKTIHSIRTLDQAMRGGFI